MKRRLLSAVLILSMLAGMCPIRALAASEDDPAIDAGVVSEADNTMETGGVPELYLSPESDEATGELRLIIHRSGTIAATDFSVELAGGPAGRLEDVLHAEEAANESSLTITGIADGTYTLTVTAANYLSYTQELAFDGRCVQVDLYNYTHINAERSGTDGDRLYGTMPVGDVNNDSVIDDADAGIITAAIGSSNLKYDLSGDGEVSLTDLAISVRNQGGVVQATPVHSISSAVLAQAVKVEPSPGTIVTGSPLSDLLNQSREDTVVRLRPNGTDSSMALTLTVDNDDETAPKVEAEALVIKPPMGSENTITAGSVEALVEDIDSRQEFTIWAYIDPDDTSPSSQALSVIAARSPSASKDANGVSVESDGTIVIDLGQRVAIKKVTIRVTATANQDNLAEIAKVQFLSDFAERIPEPQLSIPTVLSVSNTESDSLGYKSVTITWDRQPNVTGYEVRIAGEGYNKTAATENTSYTFQGDSFNGTVKSFKDYAITVRSVSGDWKSDWSEPYVHTVTCTKVPPAPEYVTATPGVNSLKVTWTCKFDAETFTLYYKHPNDASFTAIGGLTSSSYTLQNLQAGVRYTLYVVAHNRNGSSPKSANAEGMPTSPSGVELPRYKLINVDDAQGKAATHIASITGSADKVQIFGGNDWTVLVDNDPASYITINDWDSGVAYDGFRGPEITLDQVYTFDTIRFAPFEGETVSLYGAAVSYYDGNGKLVKVNASLSAKQDAQGRKYYEVTAQQPITASKFQLRTRTFNTAPITMSEVRIYNYDDLENTVAALFADDMRTELKDTVKMEDITALITRTENTIDPVSGEAHPHKATILADLEYAKALLEHNADAHVFTVDHQITANGSPSAAFAQALSDYQPLGCVAAAGDTVVIYVSDGKTARGSNVELKLVATQYHPQVSAWQSSAIQLKAGRNEITIPQIGSDASERGGSLYLQYTGARGAREYTVRATGGTYIPVLNVDGITGTERTAAIQAYVNELRDYAAQVQSLHSQLHGTDKGNKSVQYDYDVKNCFLNATEICLDNMMYSLPATEVWSALSAGSNPAGQLEISLEAMEQEIDYFYQFKGLHKTATGADAYPYTRLNIRYHKMFTGAFMYAGSKHIGIEFGSTGAVLGLTPIVSDANGKYVSGNLSGWGIAHEIGHCINSPVYQRVEVTNNMFAQLAKTGDGGEEANANFRAKYPNVYQAVATGTTGHTGDLAVQLAMYWQLHLAYDDNYAYKLYDSAAEAQAAMFYARLEAYLRDGAKAPEPFTASSGDQLFMQAACAAAGKNVLGFFRAWGFTPDTATVAYAAQYPAETRKIQYIDDDSRLYRLEKNPGMSAGTAVTASITNEDSPRINGNKVTISLSNNNTNSDAMLGYEICRNGKMVAFVPASETSYTDIVTTENNKAFIYTVTGIDRLLNETETVALPQVKVCHDGAIDKSGWSIQTNMASSKDSVVEKKDSDPESGVVSGSTTPAQEKVSAITAAIDNDDNTVYYGKPGSGRPTITLDLGGVEQVTAIKFTPVRKDYSGDAAEGSGIASTDLYKYRLFDYTIEISLDGESWTTVKTGKTYTAGSAANPDSWVPAGDVIFNGDSKGNGSYTLFFNKQMSDGSMDPYMYTYDAAYVRVTSTSMSAMALAEIDVLGPTSDNVELVSDGFGRLKEDFTSSGETIPAGSIVFYGEYKGDPSYNLVLLKDQNGKVLNGQQFILAEVTESGYLGETSRGSWLYWLEGADMDQLNGLKSVQAELYRVQDAFTLAGQRLTSTSLSMDIPSEIPEITITSSANLTAYVPSAGAVAAAAEERNTVAAADFAPYLGAVVLGDTGAAESDGTDAPIQLASDGRHITAQFRPADATNIAVQAEFTISNAPDNVQVQPTGGNNNIYQSYKYDRATGKLTLFAVAWQAGLGEGTLSAQLTPSTDCAMTVASLLVLSSDYELTSVDGLPNISVNLSPTTPPPGGDSGNTGSSGTGGGGSNTGSAGGSSGGSSNAPSTPSINVGKPSTSGSTTTVNVSASSASSGTTASATVSSSDMNAAVDSAVAEAAKRGTTPVVKVGVKTSAEADSLNVTLPSVSLRNLAKAGNASLIITSGVAEVAMDSTALSALAEQAAGDTVVLKIAPATSGSLSTAQREVVGKAPVVDLSIASDSVAIHEYNNGVITVTLPYTLSDSQSAEDVVVYYLDDDGRLTPCGTSYAGGKVTFTTTQLGKYIIGSVEMASTTEPEFEIPVPNFIDVPRGIWYTDAVMWAAANRITNGMDAASTMFAPDNICTRAQIVTFLWRAYDEPEPQTTSNPFIDVSEDDYYYKAVLWAAEKGITNGMNAINTFVPDGECIRAQAVTFLYRAAGTPRVNRASGFVDVPEGEYYTDAVQWAVSNGITNGMNSTDTFVPKGACTRAHIVTFLYRAMSS